MEEAEERVREWPWVIVAFAFVVVSPLAAMMTRDAHGRSLTTWIVVQAAATGIAWVIPQVRQLQADRRQLSAREREIDARVDAVLALDDALDPVVRLLGELALEKRKANREQIRAQAVPLVLATAAQLIGPERSRACWFTFDPGPPRQLVPVEAVGRAGQPTRTFLEGTPEGDAAVQLVLGDEELRVVDVEVDPPPGWDLDRDQAYRTFIAVSVTAGDVAYGMLTLDALEPGSLSADGARLLRLMAGALAVALSIT